MLSEPWRCRDFPSPLFSEIPLYYKGTFIENDAEGILAVGVPYLVLVSSTDKNFHVTTILLVLKSF
jgi:hypothetical protein